MVNKFMKQDIQTWHKIVSEAYEGETQIDRMVQQGQVNYGREAAQFKLPPDYPAIKTVADLLHSIDDYIKASSDFVKDPIALTLMSRLKNLNLRRLGNDLDRVAKLPNPEK
jgi:hypothetical protein